MSTDTVRIQSHIAHAPRTKVTWVTVTAVILILMMGTSASVPHASALGSSSQGISGSDLDPLLGSVLLEVDPGGSVAPGNGFYLDPLLGSVLLEVGPGGSVALGSASDLDPLLGSVLLEVGRGGSVALGSASDLDPLLGSVLLEVGPAGSVALGSEVFTCSRPDGVLAANPELAYVPLAQSC